jgi:FAD/FMN-containing dehydrogenase
MTQLSRKSFIGLGSKTIGGALLMPSLVGFLEGCSKTDLVSDFEWQLLSNQLNGTVLLPGAPGFDPYTLPYALQYGKTIPQAVVRCMTEKDVVTTVKWARQNNIAITTRSGGHSYAGYSSTNELLLDLSGMTNITLNSSTGLATVDGGARNRHVFAAFSETSLAITHAACKNVGMGGLVLGGGIGFNMRAHGLTCDQLVETRMVTADGDIVVCSEKDNPDLFWAVRGAGGGNFGIHTSFTFKPFAVSNITRFKLQWNNNPQLVFARLQEVLLSAPNTLGAKVTIEMVLLRSRGDEESIIRPVVTLMGQFKGEIAEFETLIAPINAISTPTGIPEIEPYWKAQASLTEEGAPKFIYERSRFAFEPLSAAAQASIFAKLAEWPGTSGSAKFNYFLLGGAISVTAPDATAFFARDAKMITTIELTWKDGDQNIFGNKQWLDEFHLIMEAFTSKFSYVNFIDRNEADFLNTYYGPALPRLKATKKAVDPKNYFRFPQGIPVG